MHVRTANHLTLATPPRRVRGSFTRFSCLLAMSLCAGFTTPGVSVAEFYGEKGYTVVFAFSESTSRYGWGYNTDPDAAALTALQNCGPGAKVVCYKTDGYLCLVWDGSKYAFGHDTENPQNAVGHAEESFNLIHGGQPTKYQCRSSDGDFIRVN